MLFGSFQEPGKKADHNNQVHPQADGEAYRNGVDSNSIRKLTGEKDAEARIGRMEKRRNGAVAQRVVSPMVKMHETFQGNGKAVDDQHLGQEIHILGCELASSQQNPDHGLGQKGQR